MSDMPRPLTEILVVHHTHTDWGYTTHPSQIEELNCSFIEEALVLCDRYATRAESMRYRWTCESAWMVEYFLRTRPKKLQENFLALAEQGLIEVTAGPLGPTSHNTQKTIRAALEITRGLREHWGLSVDVAMFCDINGLNWPWAEELYNAGVKYLSMAMNYFCGGGMERYKAFHWRSASGKKLLTWHGQHYNIGCFWGLNHDEFDMEKVVPVRLKELEKYQYDKLLLQVTNIPADNMGPHEALLDYIDKYNNLAQEHSWPRMRTSTLREWFSYIEKHDTAIEEYKGDWTDWWSSTLPGTPRSIGVIREVERRLALIERWNDKLRLKNREIAKAFDEKVVKLRKDSFIANEHTFGFSGSVSSKGYIALGGEAYQLNLCLTILYDATALLRDILAKYSENDKCQIIIIDSELESFDPTWVKVVGANSDSDSVSIDLWSDLPVVAEKDLKMDVKACSTAKGQDKEQLCLTNGPIKLSLNEKTRGVSLKHNSFPGKDLFETAVEGEFGQLIIEYPDGNSRDSWFPIDFSPEVQWGKKSWPTDTLWQRERVAVDVQNAKCSCSPGMDGGKLEYSLQHKGVVNLEGNVLMSLSANNQLDIEYQIKVSETTDPISLYIPFPFALKPDRVKMDVGGEWITPCKDQIPGSCPGWIAVHDGVYIEDKNSNMSLLWVSWDVPTVMLESIRPNPPRDFAPLSSSCLFSWAVSNYWCTNINPSIGGNYRFRYRLYILDHTINNDELSGYLASKRPITSLEAVKKNRNE